MKCISWNEYKISWAHSLHFIAYSKLCFSVNYYDDLVMIGLSVK